MFDLNPNSSAYSELYTLKLKSFIETLPPLESSEEDPIQEPQLDIMKTSKKGIGIMLNSSLEVLYPKPVPNRLERKTSYVYSSVPKLYEYTHLNKRT